MAENGIDLTINGNGMAINRRSLSEAQKKVLIDYHKVRYIMTLRLTAIYIRLIDVSTAKVDKLIYQVY
ncbi:hypothetical protein TSUD_84180 [Trifolium subterraneum]|uniref:Uncharacterized protein n=1 Tax=Trifolium subterraneum TaxID=3900 RepID=A0A2Z6M2A2_TRISU|nr:hypothetical protein TSUD_84180 [Trifolium subterraneum]